MTRLRTALPVALMLSLVATAAALSPPAGADAGKEAGPVVQRGGPGDWSKISTGMGGITYQSSLQRTADGVLHVVYPKTDGGDDATYGHTSIDADGSVVDQNNVLIPGWATVDPSPALIRDGDGLRVVFGGLNGVIPPDYWSDGRMYTATAAAAGDTWALPTEAVGQSTSAGSSYGTSAVELDDGTPVAAFANNSDIFWHVGTGEAVPDQHLTVDCCAYSTAMVNDGGDVWLAWYQNGNSAATNGIFVKQILPTVGPTTKAPQSSQGASSVAPFGSVGLVARTGGGVYAAYCVGYPTCDHIGLWKVGTDTVRSVPSTIYVDRIAVSPGPSGRIWVAWSDNIPRVRAVRTNVAGTSFGKTSTLGTPGSVDGIYDVAIDGTNGRGDVVINSGAGFWHTQVAPGLTLKASPGKWKHGKKQKVTFKVTDAGDAVTGAKVKVGSATCTTAATGSCALTFPKNTKKGSLVAKATLSGYGAGSVRLKVT